MKKLEGGAPGTINIWIISIITIKEGDTAGNTFGAAWVMGSKSAGGRTRRSIVRGIPTTES